MNAGCQEIFRGVIRRGKASSCWLLHISELLGRDQWKAVDLAPREELARLRQELGSCSPKLLSEREAERSLGDSAEWPGLEDFASAWFEDDAALDRVIEATKERRKTEIDPSAALTGILDNLLPQRRELWLERLVLTTLWLKSAAKPPLPWHRMFHVAEAVADQKRPLKEIPLMLAIAKESFAAYLGRREERSW